MDQFVSHFGIHLTMKRSAVSAWTRILASLSLALNSSQQLSTALISKEWLLRGFVRLMR
jgi:hypothetical protein